MQVEERFLKYVAVDTQSEVGHDNNPSTPGQWDLARLLVEELKALGVSDARVDEHCYVMGSIPSNLSEGKSAPAIGLIAHMDTATETSGKNVKPRIVHNYDGGVVVLNEQLGVQLDPASFTNLRKHLGEDLIVTDGTTLLGADNKAGVAEIMTAVECLLAHPEIPHGKLCIGFTPDEEVGRGATQFDVAAFGAEFAYTVDGGELGELEYENFNAAAADIEITGNTVHPGYAKNTMKNAALIAAKLQSMLPELETPAHTEGYEGFYHLQSISGDIAHASMQYIIREHDRSIFEFRKKVMTDICAQLNEVYGEGTVKLDLRDSYYNMREQILPHMELIDLAREAMEEVGVEPLIVAVRGGTDGARLSYMGLPCPNICCGAQYAHGPYEYCSIQTLRKIVEILLRLVQKFVH